MAPHNDAPSPSGSFTQTSNFNSSSFRPIPSSGLRISSSNTNSIYSESPINDTQYSSSYSSSSLDMEDQTHRPLVPGIYVPTVCFFDPVTEDLDTATIASHAVRLAEAGVNGLTTQGSNGEAVSFIAFVILHPFIISFRAIYPPQSSKYTSRNIRNISTNSLAGPPHALRTPNRNLHHSHRPQQRRLSTPPHHRRLRRPIRARNHPTMPRSPLLGRRLRANPAPSLLRTAPAPRHGQRDILLHHRRRRLPHPTRDIQLPRRRLRHGSQLRCDHQALATP